MGPPDAKVDASAFGRKQQFVRWLAMPSFERFEALDRAIREMLAAEVAPYVESGDAALDMTGDTYTLRPRRSDACAVSIYVQQESEISLWPKAPGTNRAPTIDLYDKDLHRLVGAVRAYLRAILAGQLELTLRTGSSSGRCRFSLDDGTVQTHLYNILFGFQVGRGSGWETFRPEPY